MVTTNPQLANERTAQMINRMQRFAWTPLVPILIVFVILSIIYAWATPPLEASDELWHVGMVNFIADNGALPVQDAAHPDEVTPYEQEGSQPPLYYMLAAGIAQLLDRSDFEAARQPNPHAIAGIPGAIGNKNLVLHPTPHNTALMVYTLRAFSILLGCVTICAVYATAQLLASDRPIIPVIAAGLTAFNPMFLFITASVNNDNLVTALNSLVVWQILFMLRDGLSTRRSVVISVLLALASLSKLSGLVLFPVVGLAALIVAMRGDYKNWRGFITFCALMAGVWLLLAGWWYLRNVMLYGELFGTRTMVVIAGARVEPFTLFTALDEFEGFRFSYWALFGAVNIMTFRWFYDMMDIVILVAVIGLAVALVRRWSDREFRLRALLLSLIVIIGFGAFLSWTAQTYASQGRLLFPFVAAISALMALGLSFPFSFIRARHALPLQIAPVIALGVFALIVPFASIAPQYTPPAPLTVLPASAHPVYARFGDVELIGYETVDARYGRGSNVPITVYWRVVEPSERDLSLWLHAVNNAGETLGTVDSYPGAGRLRTSTWQAGAIYADSYAIPLTGSMEGGSRLRVQVGWWHYPSQDNIGAVDENSQPLESVMLNVGGYFDTTPIWHLGDFTVMEPVEFGDSINLKLYRLNGNELSLWWEVTGALDDEYTVFVQVLDEGNNIIGQGDAAPVLPTQYALPGDQFGTSHSIIYPQPLPVGTYRVLVGWYAPDDFARLGADYPDSAYPLTTIEIP